MKNKNQFVSSRVRVKCICHSETNHAPASGRNKNLIRFLDSFILLPILTVAMPFSSLVGNIKTNIDTTPQIVLSQQQNLEGNSLLAFNKAMEEKKAQALKFQADAIDAYFRAHKLPLAGTGAKMASEAAKYGLDYRLMPAIAMIETTGGKFACPGAYKRTGDKGYTYNAFGWGSCKISFKSKDHAIEVIAKNLSGKNPNTARHYSGKTTKAILNTYNPEKIKPGYAAKVMKVMDAIGAEDLTPKLASAVS